MRTREKSWYELYTSCRRSSNVPVCSRCNLGSSDSLQNDVSICLYFLYKNALTPYSLGIIIVTV